MTLVVLVVATLASVTLEQGPNVPAGGAAVSGPSASWPGGRWQPDAAQYGMAVEPNVPVTMSDGAVLIANVGYPADLGSGQRASGSFPVLLTQDPYAADVQPQSFYVRRGYINAVVQVRGTGSSTGPRGQSVPWNFFDQRQAHDGVELVHWAARLPGSDGKVGLDGCSFLGIDQFFTAAAVGPHSPLKEILPACAAFGYSEIFMAGGVPSQIAQRAATPGSAGLFGAKNAAADDAAAEAVWNDIKSGGAKAYNGTWWQQRTTVTAIPKIVANGIPALLWSGWYPTDGPGSILEYAAFQNSYEHRRANGAMRPGQPVTGRYQIVMDDGKHGQGRDDNIQLEWYDTWLKGAKTRITDTQTPMHLYDNVADDWVNASTYPITGNDTAYHLDAGGTLSVSVPSESGMAALVYGQPTGSGTTLTYDAPPVSSEKIVAGPIDTTVYARSSNRNMLLIATLLDVGPAGQATQMSTGDIVGSLRAIDQSSSWYDAHGLMVRPAHPYRADVYATPGSLQRYDIELTPTVYSLLPGHHLRLVLSTQTAAQTCADVLSALSTPLPCFPTTPQQASLPGGVYRIEWGRSHPSSLNVGLVSQHALPVAASVPLRNDQGVNVAGSGLTEPIGWSSPRPSS